MNVPGWAAGVCAGVHAAGSRDVVYVPDNPLAHVLREFRARFRDVRLLLATREEEAFASPPVLYLGGQLPTVMLQSSGLENSLNALWSSRRPGACLLPRRLTAFQPPSLLAISVSSGRDGG
jgi:sulfopyruvate decarboxylase TPP-binding subunit